MKKSNLIFKFQTENSGKVCEKILRSLPDWFGIEESIVQYIKDADKMPTMIVKNETEEIGFLTIKKHFKESADIHCMGILPQYHRKGIGIQLIKKVEIHLKNEGVKILQVKTISEERTVSFMLNLANFINPLVLFLLKSFQNYGMNQILAYN